MDHEGEYLDTGAGAGIDRWSLRPIVHDRARFSAAMRASGDPADLLLEALFLGDLDRATALVDAAGPPTFRIRALTADIACAQGDFAGAAVIYEALLEENLHGPREALLHQHLGKVFFQSGDLTRARESFATAMAHRVISRAPGDQIESSRMALERVDELIDAAAARRRES
ncbi:tetratricopeptide (TPR) repeat protein [Nakamurella sp. UYEF19]|uniref:hypothetical protein n=1 Tax=Nakamurella sp. UYEF19 TaxID=1756392 RepID=UPI003399932A